MGSEGSLTPEELELVNAYGPYNHAAWQGCGLTVTSEEVLKGRGELLAAMIRAELERRYTREQMAQLTLCDVGCYDGFILHLLQDLPFRQMVGYEPRQKNITKGRKIRELLKLHSL